MSTELYPMTSDFLRVIQKNCCVDLRDNLPVDYAQQIFEFLNNNFPEEIDHDGPRPLVSSHAIQVACRHLNFEREGT